MRLNEMYYANDQVVGIQWRLVAEHYPVAGEAIECEPVGPPRPDAKRARDTLRDIPQADRWWAEGDARLIISGYVSLRDGRQMCFVDLDYESLEPTWFDPEFGLEALRVLQSPGPRTPPREVVCRSSV